MFSQDYVGIKTGINYSNITNTDLEGNPKARVGMQVGLVLKSIESENWAFQIEFLYSQKGASFVEDIVDVTYQLDMFQNNIVYNRIINKKISVSTGLFWATFVKNKTLISIDNGEKNELGEEFNLRSKSPEIGGLLRLEYSINEYISLTLDYNISLFNYLSNINGKNSLFTLGIHGYFVKG